MNREILFKAKRKNWKELPKEQWWVEGYYRCIPCMGMLEHYIMPQISKSRVEQDAIDITTLCQFTGLTDKNGRRIWENDILKANLDESYTEDITYIKILWNEYRFCVHENYSTDIDALEKWDAEHFQVCGNIFDNPDLLEVE